MFCLCVICIIAASLSHTNVVTNTEKNEVEGCIDSYSNLVIGNL